MDLHDPLVVNHRAQLFLSVGRGGQGWGWEGGCVVSLPALSAWAGQARGLEEVPGVAPLLVQHSLQRKLAPRGVGGQPGAWSPEPGAETSGLSGALGALEIIWVTWGAPG